MKSDSTKIARQDRVTFVLPNYNHARYLKRCLSAIFAQTRKVDELIIIDDGSTDDSVALITDLIAEQPCARLISLKENQGVIACLNMGLSQATGEFIAFVGADDRVHQDFVEILAAWLTKCPNVSFACGCVELRDDHGALLGYRPLVHPSKVAKQISADEYRTILESSDNHILTPVTLLRRSVIAEFGGFDPDLGSATDGILVRQLAVRNGFVFVPQNLGIWSIHGENYSVASVTDPENCNKMIGMIKQHLDKDEDFFPPAYSSRFSKRILFNAGYLMIQRCNTRREVKALMHRLLGQYASIGIADFFSLLTFSYWRLPFQIWLFMITQPYSLSASFIWNSYRRMRPKQP